MAPRIRGNQNHPLAKSNIDRFASTFACVLLPRPNYAALRLNRLADGMCRCCNGKC